MKQLVIWLKGVAIPIIYHDLILKKDGFYWFLIEISDAEIIEE